MRRLGRGFGAAQRPPHLRREGRAVRMRPGPRPPRRLRRELRPGVWVPLGGARRCCAPRGPVPAARVPPASVRKELYEVLPFTSRVHAQPRGRPEAGFRLPPSPGGRTGTGTPSSGAFPPPQTQTQPLRSR